MAIDINHSSVVFDATDLHTSRGRMLSLQQQIELHYRFTRNVQDEHYIESIER